MNKIINSFLLLSLKIGLIIKNDLLRLEMSERSIIRSQELPDYKEIALQTLNIMKELVNE